MTAKAKILAEIKDINHAYNDSSKYTTITDLLNEMTEVVRCQDCKFAEWVDPGLYICHNENIIISGGYVSANWYCADGIDWRETDE